MDAASAQLQANTVVYGEPPAVDEKKRKSMIPDANLAPHQDESDALYRETLLYMRIQLKSDARMVESLKVINTVLQNILKYP